MMKMFSLLLLLYMVSASIIRDIESDTSPVTNVHSCCNLCPSYKTQAKFQKRKMAGKLKKNKKKENQKKKMKENEKKQYLKRNKRRQNTHLNKNMSGDVRGSIRHDDPHRQCTHKTISAIKNFEKTMNWMKQTKRIKVWVTQAAKKSTKAATAFQDGLAALVTATKDGTACAGAGLDTNTQDILDTLRSCSVTAAAACDTSTLDTSGLSQCEIDLGAWIDSLKVGQSQYLIT